VKNLAILSFLLSFFLISCGDDSSSSADDSEKKINTTISGMAQWPFEEGTIVSIYELDENFEKTGINYETKIKNDSGEYSENIKKIQSQYALLKAYGYYSNLVTGEQAKDKLTLYALADLSESDKLNINLLTHLAHKRTLYLISAKNKSLKDAKKQAEKELLKPFGIKEINDDESTALLALSILLQGTFPEENINDRLTNYKNDIEKDGICNDSKTATQIADWAYQQNLDSGLTKIRSNIEKQKKYTDIPAFEKYVDGFWQANYGLGSCTDKQKNEIRKNTNSESNFSDLYFICKSKKWREATKKEKDSYYWPDSLDNIKAKEGDAYWSKIDSTVCYIHEDKSWHKSDISNCTLGLQTCTKQRVRDIDTTSNGNWYVCDGEQWLHWNSFEIDPKDSKWKTSIKNEKDTLGWKKAEQGTTRKGSKTDIIYIFDKNAWRLATIPEATLGGCTKEIEDSLGYVEIRKGQEFIDPVAISCKQEKSIKYPDGLKCPKPTNSPNSYYDCSYIDCSTSLFENGYYRCNDEQWHRVDDCTIELIKLNEGKPGKDGDSHWGTTCPSRCYVFENDSNDSTHGKWRVGDLTECALGLGGCTKSRDGMKKTGLSASKYYGCQIDVFCFQDLTVYEKSETQYVCRSTVVSDFPHEWQETQSRNIKSNRSE
jgi:hypothetical protein